MPRKSKDRHIEKLQAVVEALKVYRRRITMRHAPGCPTRDTQIADQCDCELITMCAALDQLADYEAPPRPRRPRRPRVSPAMRHADDCIGIVSRDPSRCDCGLQERQYSGTCPGCGTVITTGESNIVLAGSPPEFPTLIQGHCGLAVPMSLVG